MWGTEIFHRLYCQNLQNFICISLIGNSPSCAQPLSCHSFCIKEIFLGNLLLRESYTVEKTPDDNYHSIFGYTFQVVHSEVLPLSLRLFYLQLQINLARTSWMETYHLVILSWRKIITD